jgi:hypothetical protein
MPSNDQTARVSKKMVWAGRIISGFIVLFMIFDGVTKLLQVSAVVKAQAELGWPESQGRLLGLVLLACTAVYVIARSSVLGAILLTAYLGGATAAQARIESPNFLFSVMMGVLVWLGLYLRDERLRALVPLRRYPTDGTE